MTAKSETVGVVAWGIPGFGIVVTDVEKNLGMAPGATIPLVPESALAELREQCVNWQGAAGQYKVELLEAELRMQALLSGLEALAGRMDKRDEWMRTKSAPNIGLADAFKNAAADIRTLIPAAANTESEEVK